MQDRAVLENLAVSAGGFAEGTRGYTRGTMEGAHEIREIAKADIVGDVRDGDFLTGEQSPA